MMFDNITGALLFYVHHIFLNKIIFWLSICFKKSEMSMLCPAAITSQQVTRLGNPSHFSSLYGLLRLHALKTESFKIAFELGHSLGHILTV